MKTKNWLENMLAEFQNDPEYHSEKLRLEIIEQMLELMERMNITRAELARKLGCSNAYITKLLNGSENLTLLKLAQIASALHSRIDVKIVPRNLRLEKTMRDEPTADRARVLGKAVRNQANIGRIKQTIAKAKRAMP